jgi:hypothetical protein
MLWVWIFAQETTIKVAATGQKESSTTNWDSDATNTLKIMTLL